MRGLRGALFFQPSLRLSRYFHVNSRRAESGGAGKGRHRRTVFETLQQVSVNLLCETMDWCIYWKGVPRMQLTTTDLANITLSILVSLGGGGTIVLSLSNWLGKMWAERFMQKEQARYEKEPEDFKPQ